MKNCVLGVIFPALLALVLLGSPSPGAPAQQLPRAGQRTAPERSNALTLTVAGVSTQLSVEDLSRMPQASLTVHNAHSNRDEVYTGVSLAGLLGSYGLRFDKETQGRLLHSYLRAQGTDNYFVLYSVAELVPELHTAEVIVALQMDGRPLAEEGRLKMVASGDKRPARWVRNLTSLTVTTIN